MKLIKKETSTRCSGRITGIGYPGSNDSRRIYLYYSTDNEVNCSGAASKGTITHEIGHGLGLYHEHQRGDRDEYIIVGENSVDCKKYLDRQFLTSFDRHSLMHYNPDACSGIRDRATGQPVPVPGAKYHGSFSDLDVIGLQVMYGDQYQPTLTATSATPGQISYGYRNKKHGNVIVKSWWHTRWYEDDLGGSILGAPVVVASAPNRIDVVARGIDRSIWHRWWDGGSSWEPVGHGNWAPLGGQSSGQPIMVARGPGKLNMFTKGDGISDHQIWHRAFDGANWSNWESAGGFGRGPLEAVAVSPTKTRLFAIADNMGLYTKLWTEGVGFEIDWEPLGGMIRGLPSVVAYGHGDHDSLMVFVKGLDGKLFTKWFFAPGDTTSLRGWWPQFGGWDELDVEIVGNPVAISRTKGIVDLFFQGMDGTLRQKTYIAGQGWVYGDGESHSHGGQLSGAPQPVSWSNNRLDVFYRNKNDAAVHQKWWTPGGGWEPTWGSWNQGGTLEW